MSIDLNLLIVILASITGIVCITAMTCSYMYFSNKNGKAKFSINAKDKSASFGAESYSDEKRYKKK